MLLNQELNGEGVNIQPSLRRNLFGGWALGAALVFCLLLVLRASTAAGAEPMRFFSIKINEKLIGYASISTDRTTLDGKPVVRWKSHTSLKVALLGKVRNTLLDSETLLDVETGAPLRYRMTDNTNDAVRHVDVDFSKGVAYTWIYPDGEAKGNPKKTELPPGAVILGGNNFAHWHLMLQAATKKAQGGPAVISVFLPDNGQVTSFTLNPGKPKEFKLGGVSRSCISWTFEQAKLHALADSKTNEFVGLLLPAQQTKIEIAHESIVKLAQKARAEELLAKHFAQSNITFDNFLGVRSLKAKIDVRVIGSGIENKTDVLTTTMQAFKGQKNLDHIEGEVEIKSLTYDGSQSPAFPQAKSSDDLKQWLQPATYIESDHDPIVALAKKLTKDSKTRWDAVQAIGSWVSKEISYTIADTPSARMALEKKEGDCGPHSTLTVAMLRAVGIPARLVGGLVYTPSFGGSFGQHAWVEVHMGDAGWLAIDPTTGEFATLSATHVKLFEGMGGVLPASIKVESFAPQNRKIAQSIPLKAKPLAWEIGKKYRFKFKKGEEDLGNEDFVIRQVEREGKKAFELTSNIKLKVNFFSSLVSESKMVVAPNAMPIAFERELAVAFQKVKLDCQFKDRIVDAKSSGTTNLEREVKLPEQTYCFDNNLLGGFALICSQLPLNRPKPTTVQTFHPSSMQIIPLTFTPKGAAKVTIGEREIECVEFEVSPIKNTFFIARDNRLIQVQAGDAMIRLTEIEANK